MNNLLLFALSVFLIGCGPAGPGPGDIRLKRQLTAEQVVGVWKLQNDCFAWLVDREAYEPHPHAVHQIELRPDGTCRFRSVLQYSKEYVDYEGTWSLIMGDKNTTTLTLRLDKKLRHGLRFDFTDLFGKVELFEYWGDPDACEIIRFEKIGQHLLSPRGQ